MDGVLPGGMKVFCIGLQKTGTSSLLTLLRECGIDARGRNQAHMRLYLAGDYEAILREYDKAECFKDWPTPLMYKLAYAKYGERARFILTVRKDAQTWFTSLKRHNLFANPFRNKHHWVFGHYYPHGFEAEHIAYYDRHIREVTRFFRERGASHQLLVLQIDDPEAPSKIARFLGIPVKHRAAPRVNVSTPTRPGIGNRIKRGYNVIVQSLYERAAPRLFHAPAQQLLEADLQRGIVRAAPQLD